MSLKTTRHRRYREFCQRTFQLWHEKRLATECAFIKSRESGLRKMFKLPFGFVLKIYKWS